MVYTLYFEPRDLWIRVWGRG